MPEIWKGKPGAWRDAIPEEYDANRTGDSWWVTDAINRNLRAPLTPRSRGFFEIALDAAFVVSIGLVSVGSLILAIEVAAKIARSLF